METLGRVYEAAQRGEHVDLVVWCGNGRHEGRFALNAAVVAAECGYFRTLFSTSIGPRSAPPASPSSLRSASLRSVHSSSLRTAVETELECDPATFALIVRCIYTGSLDTDSSGIDRALDVIALAVFLDCGLCERLATQLIVDQKALFDPDTAVHVWLESTRIGARTARSIAAGHIAAAMPRAARCRAFLAMPKPDVVGLLSSDEFAVRTEVHVAEALCAWCEANGEQCTSLDSRVVRLVWNDPAPRHEPTVHGILVLGADDTRFRFFTAGHEWIDSPVPDLRLPRGTGAALCRVGRSIFVLGGSHALPVETFEARGAARPESDEARRIGRSEEERSAQERGAKWRAYDYRLMRPQVACAVVGSCIYVVGGVSGLRPSEEIDILHTSGLLPLSGLPESGLLPLSGLFPLSGSTRMSRARRMCVVAETNGAVLVAGGFDSIGSALASAEFVRTRSASAPRMREPRAAAAHATVGADVYVAGGIGAHHEAVRTAEYFDAATEEWVELPPMPRARAHCAGAALGPLAFYVVGGTERNGRPASSVFALDITTCAWTEVPAPTIGECSATTISFGA